MEEKKNDEYVVLMETNGKECESWYYFLRRTGNQENLLHLKQQLDLVDWFMVDDLSIFDLDLTQSVSAQTAKEMTKLEINSIMFHRKFDGKLKKIDLGFKPKNSNIRKIEKTFDLLSYGQIEDYISDEDVDRDSSTENNSDDSRKKDRKDSCEDLCEDSCEDSCEDLCEDYRKLSVSHRIPSNLLKKD